MRAELRFLFMQHFLGENHFYDFFLRFSENETQNPFLFYFLYELDSVTHNLTTHPSDEQSHLSSVFKVTYPAFNHTAIQE